MSDLSEQLSQKNPDVNTSVLMDVMAKKLAALTDPELTEFMDKSETFRKVVTEDLSLTRPDILKILSDLARMKSLRLDPYLEAAQTALEARKITQAALMGPVPGA